MADIMAHPELTTLITKDQDYEVQLASTTLLSGVRLFGIYEKSCVIRASIRVNNEPFFVWEFRDPDGSHKYFMGYIGALSQNENDLTIFNNIKHMQNPPEGKWVSLSIWIKIKNYSGKDKWNPFVLGIIPDDELDKRNSAYDSLIKTKIIPADFSQMDLWTDPLEFTGY
jgi:hypothetical protein